jgi:hypothetical protein
LVHQKSELLALDFNALQGLLWLKANKYERQVLILLNCGGCNAVR